MGNPTTSTPTTSTATAAQVNSLDTLQNALAVATNQAGAQSNKTKVLDQANKLLTKSDADLQKKIDAANVELDKAASAISEINTKYTNKPMYASEVTAATAAFTTVKTNLETAITDLTKAKSDLTASQLALLQKQNLLSEKTQVLTNTQTAFGDNITDIQNVIDQLTKARLAAADAVSKSLAFNALVLNQIIDYWKQKLTTLLGTNTLWTTFGTALAAYSSASDDVATAQNDVSSAQIKLTSAKTKYDKALKDLFDAVNGTQPAASAAPAGSSTASTATSSTSTSSTPSAPVSPSSTSPEAIVATPPA